jgi:hypothetical protein
MEQIINGFKNLVFIKNENLEMELSELIFNIEKMSTHDPEFEWKRLTQNYSKLKTLSKLINCEYNGKCHFFYKPLLLFMKKMDSVNEYYLKNIDLENTHDLNEFKNLEDIDSLLSTYKIIKNGLIHSIDSTNPYDKLNSNIIIYKTIIELLETLNGLEYTFIEDPEIEREFNSKRQRTK